MVFVSSCWTVCSCFSFKCQSGLCDYNDVSSGRVVETHVGDVLLPLLCARTASCPVNETYLVYGVRCQIFNGGLLVYSVSMVTNNEP